MLMHATLSLAPLEPSHPHATGLAPAATAAAAPNSTHTSSHPPPAAARPAHTTCSLSDVSLLLPLVGPAVPLVNGFGHKGAARPQSIVWRWDDPPPFGQAGLNCRVWVGSALAGMQLNLQSSEAAASAAASSCANDENGRLQCSDLSNAQYNAALGNEAWFNKNRGFASITDIPPGSVTSKPPQTAPTAGRDGGPAAGIPEGGTALLRVSTGPVRVPAADDTGGEGGGLTLSWRLLLTPVRGGGALPRADMETRHFHMQRFAPVEAALAAARNPVIILHQGNQLNPYINYPFLTLAPLRAFMSSAHAAGARVKLYYTVRELSTSAPELWAFRAMRGEVVIKSPVAGGNAWLREHLRGGYDAAWHEVLATGEVDASIHTPAFTSRLDNFWIEGILYLARHLDLDGIYLDGAPYDAAVLRRLRRALDTIQRGRERPFLLDLHASCAGNPHLPYVELYPYLDSLWFGEQCNYAAYSPEQWLAEVRKKHEWALC